MDDLEKQVLAWVESDRQRIVGTCCDLVRFNTSSSHGDTRNAMEYIKRFFRTEGIPVREFAACKTMPNLLSGFRTNRRGRHLMLNGHLDTMPAGKEPGWTVSPWSGTIRDGKIIGRGVSDMKAGVTAMLFAYNYLWRMKEKLSGQLSISLVSDEESGWGRGTGYLFKKVSEKMAADCVLSGEPSDVRAISFASKGYIQITVNVRTRGAIAGYSNENQSAIEIATAIVRDLKALENTKIHLPVKLRDFLARPGYAESHEKVRGKGHLEQLSRVTVDACTIKGGGLSSVIAPDCKLTAAIVFPWGTDVEKLLDGLQNIATKYQGAELTVDGVDMPDDSPDDGELPNILSDTVAELGHARPVMTPDIALSDCRYWRQRGIPAYWYGPGGDLCSAGDESVVIEDLILITKVHSIAAIRYIMHHENWTKI